MLEFDRAGHFCCNCRFAAYRTALDVVETTEGEVSVRVVCQQSGIRIAASGSGKRVGQPVGSGRIGDGWRPICLISRRRTGGAASKAQFGAPSRVPNEWLRCAASPDRCHRLARGVITAASSSPWRNQHETHLPAVQGPSCPYAWFFGAHEDARWPRGHQRAPWQGPQATRAVTHSSGAAHDRPPAAQVGLRTRARGAAMFTQCSLRFASPACAPRRVPGARFARVMHSRCTAS